MARYYRRRYTRVVRPKKKWATNMTQLSKIDTSVNSPKAYAHVLLVENQAQTGTPTPVMLKAGNFKVQADVSYTSAGPVNVEVRAYVLFVPEGMTIATYLGADSLISNHPEWIMGWKYASIDFAVGTVPNNTQTIQFSSRLKRNLNSGDRIMFVCLFKSTDETTNITGYTLGGGVQFWTCAN